MVAAKTEARAGEGDPMNKAELVSTVAAVAGTSKVETERVLDGFRDLVQATVKKGEAVSYPGLGKFSRVSHKRRMARNPRTGDPVQVSASKALKFSASAGLKAVVNGDASAPRLPRRR